MESLELSSGLINLCTCTVPVMPTILKT